MKTRTFYRFLTWLLIISMLLPSASASGSTVAHGGVTLNPPSGELSPVSEYAASGGVGVEPFVQPATLLSQADYQHLADQAKNLLATGITFRATQLQNLPANLISTIDLVWNNYENYNNGTLLDRFCKRDSQQHMTINGQGYCSISSVQDAPFDYNPQDPDLSDNSDIRNRLIYARDLYSALLVADPINMKVSIPTQAPTGQPYKEPACFATLRSLHPNASDAIPAHEMGEICLLESTREIANAHVLFGNEYIIDAYTYRFRPDVRDQQTYQITGRQIMTKEVELLQKAELQFELAANVMTHAFNADLGGTEAIHLARYFTDEEFKLFGQISERLVSVNIEIANRLRRLNWAAGGDQQAIALYDQAYTTQYIQAVALARQAEQNKKSFEDNNGWEILTNLNRLQAEAMTIRTGSDPFGFPNGYAPITKFSFIKGTVFTPHFEAAKSAEDDARKTIEDFGAKTDTIQTRLDNIDGKYSSELENLCGSDPTKKWESCGDPQNNGDGGLIHQNRIDLSIAANHLRAAEVEIQNLNQKIADLEAANNQIRLVIVQGGQDRKLSEIAAAAYNARRCTDATITAYNTEDIYRKSKHTEPDELGFSILKTVGLVAGAVVGAVGSVFTAGASTALTVGAIAGLAATATQVGEMAHNTGSWSDEVEEKVWQTTTMQSTQHSCTYEPNQQIIGNIRGEQAYKDAIETAQIRGIEKEYEVRDLMRSYALLLIQRYTALLEYDKRLAEHESLSSRYRMLINLRSQERQTIVNGYLNHPAYRILRDAAVLNAEQKLDQAIQYAYLAAKSLEYEYARPMNRWPLSGGVGPYDIFLARTAQNVDNYRLYLQRIRAKFGAFAPSPKNPQIRLANDIAPSGVPFQQWLRGHLSPDTSIITIPFQTTLAMKNALGEHIFNIDRFNERITGLPNALDPDDLTPWFVGNGVRCDIKIDNLPSLLKAPTLGLEQRAPGEYRNYFGETVYYTPGEVILSEFESRPHIKLNYTKAGLSCLVNGQAVAGEKETYSGDLFSRSVAADWVLTINLNENASLRDNLSLITDIVFTFDTIGFTQQTAAEMQAAEAAYSDITSK